MENPYNVLAIDDIKLLTGKNLKPVLCSSKDIDYALKNYPDSSGEATAIAIAGPSKLIQALTTLVFMIVMFIPLLILILWLIPQYPSIVKWLSDFNNLLIVLLWWGFYCIILYWGYGIFFEEKKESPESPESNQS